jgi:hypothetical protein
MSETCFISLHKSSGIDCKKSGGERELPKKQETRLKVDIFFHEIRAVTHSSSTQKKTKKE